MSRNCNCGSGCSCRIVPGDGIIVTGAGSATDPLVISASVTSFAGTIVGGATPTVAVHVTGTGSAGYDPFVITAESVVSMRQLSDVDDPSGPNFGDVPVWNGAAFEFAPPPTTPPGAVNVGGGLTGDGSLGAPLSVAVSDTTTTDTSGLAIYVDSDGELRAVPQAVPSTDVSWSAITGKPTVFPTNWSLVSGKPTISTAVPSNGTGSDGDAWWRYQ